MPALRDFETAVGVTVCPTVHQAPAGGADRRLTAGLRAELFANAVVAAHNHVLRRWLRGDVTNPRSDLAEALAATWPIYRGGSARTAVVVMSTDEPIESLTSRIRGLIGD